MNVVISKSGGMYRWRVMFNDEQLAQGQRLKKDDARATAWEELVHLSEKFGKVIEQNADGGYYYRPRKESHV